MIHNLYLHLVAPSASHETPPLYCHFMLFPVLTRHVYDARLRNTDIMTANGCQAKNKQTSYTRLVDGALSPRALRSDSSLIIRSGEAEPGDGEQIFRASDRDGGYDTRAQSASQQLAVFSPSSTVTVSLARVETPVRSVMALFWEEWGCVSGFQEGNRSRVSVWER